MRLKLTLLSLFFFAMFIMSWVALISISSKLNPDGTLNEPLYFIPLSFLFLGLSIAAGVLSFVGLGKTKSAAPSKKKS